MRDTRKPAGAARSAWALASLALIAMITALPTLEPDSIVTVNALFMIVILLCDLGFIAS